MSFRVACLVLAIIGAQQAAFAADKTTAPSDEKLAKMQQRLDLTDTQLSEMRKIRDQGGTSQDMRAVLTDEQKAQAKQHKKKHQKMKNKNNQNMNDKSGKRAKQKSRGKTGNIA